MLGVVGGSSLYNLESNEEFATLLARHGMVIKGATDLVVDNDWGKGVKVRRIDLQAGDISHCIVFIQRHSHAGDGITPPHKINYHANMRALYDQGVDCILATTSVGTLCNDIPPGRVGVARQYIDFSGNATTYHEEDAKFTSVTRPFDEKMNGRLLKILRAEQKLPDAAPLEFTYWLSTGPQYETEGEVDAIDRMGGHVVGMTMPREAKLCAELGKL